MRKKLGSIAVVAAVAAVGFAPAGASAAHCVEGSSPGFSYFGSNASEGNDRGSFDGGTSKGASVCRDATGSPSDRAPGQNRQR
jgi:hypothetical protein